VIIRLIDKFCLVTGLSLNPVKPMVHTFGFSEAKLGPFKQILLFNFIDLSSGFKYLGYFLKEGI